MRAEGEKRRRGWSLPARQGALNSAVLAFPLFLVYQIGIVLGSRTQNGADFVSRLLFDLCGRDFGVYMAVLAGMTACYVLAIAILRGSEKFAPRAFLPMLAESAVYALSMGSLILYVIQEFMDRFPALAIGGVGMGDIVVISAGAGFFEELAFRVVLMGGLARLLSLGMGRTVAWVVALGASALLFSLVHHLGPGAEAFTQSAFIYRWCAGVFFGLVYQLRGFAVVAWTHALYDVYVLSLG